MTEEQKKIVDTMKEISEMIESGQLPINQCPFSDLRTVYYCALCYPNDITRAESIAADYCKLLQTIASMGAKEELCQMLKLMIKSMEYEYEKRNYYEDQNILLNKQLEDEKNNHSIYDEIVEYYKTDRINEKFLNEHTYQSLICVKEKGNIDLFKKISSEVYKKKLEQLKEKKIKKIVFFLKDSAEWSCEELYQKFSQTAEYEVSIVVAPFYAGTDKTIQDTYMDTIKYFEKRNFHTIGMYDIYQNRFKSWKEIGVPDIVFHLNPHYTAFRESSDICNFPLSILNVYIPYGMMIYGNVEQQFNQLSHMLYWKIFCETPLHKIMTSKYADIGDYNVISSGYVKMDSFLKVHINSERKIWKIPVGVDNKKIKKIIYAPHWSVKDAFTGFGNFDKIYMQIYEYAKNNTKTTSWVFRPHPMLRAGAVQQGVFKSEEEYDNYLGMWNELPNAQVIENGMYVDIFETSDAMILDSVSFLAEYLYMHKPMLFLTRDRNTFNDFGKELVKVLYKVDGGDFDGIRRFIETVVMRNQDTMQKQREDFFEKYLDYEKRNGMLASEYVYQYIDKQVHTRGENE